MYTSVSVSISISVPAIDITWWHVKCAILGWPNSHRDSIAVPQALGRLNYIWCFIFSPDLQRVRLPIFSFSPFDLILVRSAVESVIISLLSLLVFMVGLLAAAIILVMIIMAVVRFVAQRLCKKEEATGDFRAKPRGPGLRTCMQHRRNMTYSTRIWQRILAVTTPLLSNLVVSVVHWKLSAIVSMTFIRILELFTLFTFLSVTQPLYTCKSISRQKPDVPCIHHTDSSILSRRHPVATATAVRAIWILVLWVKTAQVPCEPMIASNFIDTDPEAERWTIDIAVWEKAQKAATCLG